MSARVQVGRSGLRRIRLRFLALALAVTLVMPAEASALTLLAPHDVLGTLQAKASLSSSDSTGVVMLLVDGAAVRSAEATAASSTVTFRQVALKPGAHSVSVVARSSDGVTATPGAQVVSWRRPVPPVLVSPGGGYCGQKSVIVVKAGPDTTRLDLWLNGRACAARAVVPGQTVNLGTFAMGKGTNTITLKASNPVASASGSFGVRRLDFPWPTCIVVDKSDYRLYWVRDGMLVKTYPVAIGKPSTPTPERVWKVGVKYVYDVWGVYGPRRLRLYKRVGTDSYQYTGYGIHGTNQEWVIGTMASHGCIRMYNRDVIELYPQVPLGTMVLTRE